MSEQNIEHHVNVISKQWEILKSDLSSGKVRYDDIPQLLSHYTFFKVFADLFKNTSHLLEVPLSSITQMYRGVSGEIDIENYERMTPKIEFATKNNRMNPPGEVFIYLSVLGKDKGKPEALTKKFVITTVLNEIRAEKGTKATICRFDINSIDKEKKILNIFGDTSIPTESRQLYKYLFKKTSGGKDKEKLALLLANVYFNIFSNEEIFKPIHSTQEEIKEYEYAPFHALANYIKEKDYDGILFRSTVHRNGTNLVLFNPADVQVVKESMEHINTNDYLT
ncbi:RES family NAD+ phosphorylase [Kurthia sp. Dielmo]|uniref:RES family NAD+ phosphorylase n=1 Tax=Kurthia sp. Dielmo TaxID=1033738 RepID=UPI001124366B|nr:RES family NAD+ phosphorylase [Kurthia sp. Dielmo]